MTQEYGKLSIAGCPKNVYVPFSEAKVPGTIHLFVNAPGYDDTGRVLRGMGQGFEFENASEFERTDPKTSVLFLNCGGPRVAKAARIRRFVEDGGTVYASDQQATFIARAFPEVFGVSQPMPAGDFKAILDDEGLKNILGKTLRLRFEVGDWRFLIPKSECAAKVYMSIPPSGLTQASGNTLGTAIPAVLGYDMPGGGTVFFTAFHGVTQQSRKIKELIRFLILRPVMSRELRTARLTINQASDSDCLEFVGVLSNSMPSRDHATCKAGVWRMSLSWHGNARLRLELRDQSGQVYAAAESRQSPVVLAGRTSGDAYMRARSLESETDHVPYCLLATRDFDRLEHR